MLKSFYGCYEVIYKRLYVALLSLKSIIVSLYNCVKNMTTYTVEALIVTNLRANTFMKVIIYLFFTLHIPSDFIY